MNRILLGTGVPGSTPRAINLVSEASGRHPIEWVSNWSNDALRDLRTEAGRSPGLVIELPEDCNFGLWAAARAAKAWIAADAGKPPSSLVKYLLDEEAWHPIACPLPHRVASVWKAARCRQGQDFWSEPNQENFWRVLMARLGDHLDPQFDILFPGPHSEFTQEVQLLSRDADSFRHSRAAGQRSAACLPVLDLNKHEEVCRVLRLADPPQCVLPLEWAVQGLPGETEEDRFGVVIYPVGKSTQFFVDPRLALDHSQLGTVLPGGLIPSLFKNAGEPIEKTGSPGALRILTFELNDCLGDSFPKAFGVIAEHLWDKLREATGRSRHLPLDFRKKHAQGDDGLVCVWSRDGVALASSSKKGKDKIPELRTVIDELNKLVEDNKPSAKTPEVSADLTRRFQDMDCRMAQPQFRLLRRLFAELNFVEIARVSFEQTVATQTLDNAKQTRRIQQKLEFVELFIISFYVFELVHFTLEKPLTHAFHNHWWNEYPSAVFALLTGGAIYGLARPYLLGKHDHSQAPGKTEEQEQREEKQQQRRVALWLLGIGIGLLLALAGLAMYHSAHSPSAPDPHPKINSEADPLKRIETPEIAPQKVVPAQPETKAPADGKQQQNQPKNQRERVTP